MLDGAAIVVQSLCVFVKSGEDDGSECALPASSVLLPALNIPFQVLSACGAGPQAGRQCRVPVGQAFSCPQGGPSEEEEGEEEGALHAQHAPGRGALQREVLKHLWLMRGGRKQM